jgi:hypothetical protein
MHQDLRDGVRELRKALRVVAAHLEPGEDSKPSMRDLGTAVDGLRGSIWGILQDAHTDDLREYQAEVRVARAGEICGLVLEHLYTATIRPDLEGYEMLRASLRELHAIAGKEMG